MVAEVFPLLPVLVLIFSSDLIRVEPVASTVLAIRPDCLSTLEVVVLADLTSLPMYVSGRSLLVATRAEPPVTIDLLLYVLKEELA